MMADEPQERVPLDEFCQDVSRGDGRVELIAVFRHRELSAGRHHDTPDAYMARYTETEGSPTAGQPPKPDSV